MAHALYKPLLMTSITASSILTGCLFSLSYVSTAAVLSSPCVDEGHMLTTWRVVFNRGFRLCPTNAIFSGLCSLLNAYFVHRDEGGSVSSNKVYALVLAGVCMIGIIPYTLFFIVPVEDMLLRKESELAKRRQSLAKIDDGLSEKAGRENETSYAKTKQSLERWISLNYGRTILPFVGALISWSVW